MKEKYKSQKLAFSLIEISMVILVIGILIAGISQGIDLYQDTKFSIAQTLTKNSRVNRIADLEMWLETTLDDSFVASEKIANSNISKWIECFLIELLPFPFFPSLFALFFNQVKNFRVARSICTRTGNTPTRL